MFRKTISFFMSLLFLVFLTAPTVIVMVDNSIDVSVFYTTSEEEDKGLEKNKDLEVLFFDSNNSESDFASKEKKSQVGYYFKNYLKPHLNLISPPPKFI